jgi:thiamine biosynthesis lipoprotein
MGASEPSGFDSGTGDTGVAVRSLRAIGTMASVVVTATEYADEALDLLTEDLRALDDACSRFRADSELRRLETEGRGRPRQVSPLLFDAIDMACSVAVMTSGIVDPTVGSALIELGYDRDFDRLGVDDPVTDFRPRPAPGWWRIELDHDARTVAIPVGVHVDLGASAKAWAADSSATRIATALGCGVLVNLGGDVAVSGAAPQDGWAVGIAAACTSPASAIDQVVAISGGGLATSGTTARSWVRGGRSVHHIVDPWTGEAAPAVWALVSTTAPSCVEANAFSTAAVVWGADAVGNLADRGVSARLVDGDGIVVHCGGWPAEPAEPAGPHRPVDLIDPRDHEGHDLTAGVR